MKISLFYVQKHMSRIANPTLHMRFRSKNKVTTVGYNTYCFAKSNTQNTNFQLTKTAHKTHNIVHFCSKNYFRLPFNPIVIDVCETRCQI